MPQVEIVADVFQLLSIPIAARLLTEIKRAAVNTFALDARKELLEI